MFGVTMGARTNQLQTSLWTSSRDRRPDLPRIEQARTLLEHQGTSLVPYTWYMPLRLVRQATVEWL